LISKTEPRKKLFWAANNAKYAKKKRKNIFVFFAYFALFADYYRFSFAPLRFSF